MSTPNFCNFETKKYYAIGVTEETCEDEFLYDDTKDNVYYELEKLSKNSQYKLYNHDENKMYHQLFNRSYGGTYITTLENSRWIGDIEITVNIHAVLSGAYYQGATLDYISDIEINGNTFDDIENFEKYFDYTDLEDSDMPIGMQKIQSKNIIKFVRFAYDVMTEQIENIYEQFCDVKLQRVAVFSNGEAIYSQVS